jgi:hypothetical protein
MSNPDAEVDLYDAIVLPGRAIADLGACPPRK